jgi:CheY-like chemotaxis protein
MPELHLVSITPSGRRTGEPTLILNRFPSVIGRKSSCDCCLDDHLVSRRHCVITFEDGHFYLQDLGSTNGTRVNGLNARSNRPLEDGDWVEISHLSYRVRLRKGEGAEEEAEVTPAGRRVLVVDDDPTMAETLARLLQSWGHEVRVAHDGPEALQAARAQPPEVVFLEIDLPSMSGLEVARQLREEERLRNAKLVAVTGDEGALTVLRSRERFEQLLVKPVSSRVLRDAMRPTG